MGNLAASSITGWDQGGSKRRKGDGRTPEGDYILDYRLPDSDFSSLRARLVPIAGRHASGAIEGRALRGWLFPRGAVTPQATRSPRMPVRCTPR